MQHKRVVLTLVDGTKGSLFNYLYLLCIILFAGSATLFARELGDIRTWGNGFALIITFFFWLKNRIRINSYYVKALGVFLLYAAITSINNHMVNLHWISEWFIWLTIAYGICQAFKEELFLYVETAICHLSFIAMVCWVIHLIEPELMLKFVTKYQFSEPYAEECNVVANILFYTICDSNSESGFELITRNAGFAWEPGAFACMICLALFCNILRTNWHLRGNYSMIILILALLSTQSTTGFIILIITIIVWLLINRRFWLALLFIPILVFLFTQPFVREKLFSQIGELGQFGYNDMTGAIGRLYSLQIEWEEFLRHPIIGLGGYSEGTWIQQHGYDIVTITGIGHMLTYFGAIMTLVFLIVLIRSCFFINKKATYKNAFILMIVMIGMMFSYDLWRNPLFMAFWIMSVFGKTKKDRAPEVKKSYLPPIELDKSVVS